MNREDNPNRGNDQPHTFEELYRQAEQHEDYWLAGAIQELTEELFRLMEVRGLSRSDLARRLGTSPAYVTKILRGDANFTVATLVKLSRALGCELQIRFNPVEQKTRPQALRVPQASRSAVEAGSAKSRRSRIRAVSPGGS